MTQTNRVLEPFRLGDLDLPNRVVMAPLTRHRALPDTLAPQPMNALYYAQRATAGLIISEASQISQQGQGYINTPGLYSEAQIAGWTGVTNSVHQAGGRIFAQLWHVGRVSHVSLQPGGGAPVAPSAVEADTRIFIESGFVAPSPPRALLLDELPGIVASYRQAAENAKRAGFDGVEIHAANGYLLDQFMRQSSNKRTDAYGGTVENRIRLTLEVVEALVGVWGKSRVGIRIAPTSTENGMLDGDPRGLFGTLSEQLNRRGIAYIHAVEGVADGTRDVSAFDFSDLRQTFNGALIFNNGYTPDMADAAIEKGRCDMVAFGRPFIANPDLVRRIAEAAPLAETDEATVYGGDQRGYTDYPALA